MPPGDGKLKPEDEIILAVILSIVGFAILSFTFYKIHTHTKRLNEQQRREADVERNGQPPGSPGIGRGGGSSVGRPEMRSRGLGDGMSEKGWTAGNLAPKASVTTATETKSKRSRLSAGSGSDSGADGETKLYVEHKAELPGDIKAPDEIDGTGLSAAKNKFELEGSNPPVELPTEPMRFSWTGVGTGTHGNGTMGSMGTMSTDETMARSPSNISDATTLFRYQHKPSYALRTPIQNTAENEGGMSFSSAEGHPRLANPNYGGSSSARVAHNEGDVSPMSPPPRSVRTFSLDGTVVETQVAGNVDVIREPPPPKSAPATVMMTDGKEVTAIEPVVLRKDKWKVWRALGEEARRKH